MAHSSQEGNWDIVGNNIPVFFIQDAIKFPDIIHAVKPYVYLAPVTPIFKLMSKP